MSTSSSTRSTAEAALARTGETAAAMVLGLPGTECKICGNATGNSIHQAKEMMFGWGDGFSYIECGHCGCVVLERPPADPERFYPPDYCSFRGKEIGIKGVAKRLRVQAYFGHSFFGLGSWIARRYPRPDLAAMAHLAFPKDWRILDVGCGGGKLLSELSTLGYENLMGADPFVESDLDLGKGVRVKKCCLTELAAAQEAGWDVVMFHHSLEHIRDQLETLQAAARLLAPKGICVIRIPVIGQAWHEYGTNWVQLDPPRHLFLHTERSMEYLSQRARLKVKSIEYDSNEFQFWGSELYRRGIPLRTRGVPRRFFSAKQFAEFRKKSLELNSSGRGDQAVFVLGVQ